jgi:hypothetical protein
LYFFFLCIFDVRSDGPHLLLLLFFQEIDEVSNQILNAEEALLEALCFDFVVDSPHADLVDLFETHGVSHRLQDFAWSIAHDSSVPSMQAVFGL